MKPILQVHELAKQYGDFTAVKGVSFEIGEGEIFSLLGPNGAGKTTTISMLACLLQPSAGEASIAGHSVRREPQAVKRLIGVIPQDIALYPSLSARENLHFWGQLYGLRGKERGQRVEDVLELVGLRERAQDRIEKYSGGMKRRINIAAGLLHRPKIVFMDEPTVGIDPQSRRAILDMVKAFNQQGMAVLYTTHYMEEAEELSDRVGIIDHGELIAAGTQRELTERIGSTETLVLHIDESQDANQLAHALEDLPGVIQSTVTDHQVSLVTPSAREVLAGAFGRAEALGTRVRSIDIQEPNLEAVFLQVTGRALRDN
ncbi:MAG: ATP-binding cassette domain-containing protein [Anaerolineales bacterium]|nr:ATP-binding cassette domain-containing protein [Anaerolineales bacterium]